MSNPKYLIINTPYICPQQHWEQARDGTVSLPFEAGDHRKVAMKIVKDRG